MFWSPFSRRDAYNFDDSHTAIDVARYIVAFCTQHGLAIDSIQLQAILYCVQVASLKERLCTRSLAKPRKYSFISILSLPSAWAETARKRIAISSP